MVWSYKGATVTLYNRYHKGLSKLTEPTHPNFGYATRHQGPSEKLAVVTAVVTQSRRNLKICGVNV